MQLEKALQVKGIWRRWSSYEIVNGAVSPAVGAELIEYDPWDAYRKNADKYRTVEQPYNCMLELAATLELERQKGVVPSRPNMNLLTPTLGPQNDADRSILQWCNEHGLLGLVPVLSTEIRLDHELFHYRDGGMWLTHFEAHDREGRVSTTTRPQTEQGENDSLTRSVDGHSTQQTLTWFSDSVCKYEKTRLSDKRVFFDARNRSDHFAPWRPGSRAFWSVYSEPVQDIAKWCTVFTKATYWLSQPNSDTEFLTTSFKIIRNLAESVTPSFRLYPARKAVLDEERISPGLLASFALMFAWDHVEGRRVIQCKRCDRHFVSDDHRAAYCSPRCRSTAQRRRYRAKRAMPQNEV